MLYRVRHPEPEPPGKHSGKEKLPFNRKKPLAGPGLPGGTFLLRVGRVKDKKERDRTERVTRGGEREKTFYSFVSKVKDGPSLYASAPSHRWWPSIHHLAPDPLLPAWEGPPVPRGLGRIWPSGEIVGFRSTQVGPPDGLGVPPTASQPAVLRPQKARPGPAKSPENKIQHFGLRVPMLSFCVMGQF